jgi:tRNA G18 (ribose-2'-O)-methylase SpoU
LHFAGEVFRAEALLSSFTQSGYGRLVMAESPAPLMLALFEPDIAQNAGAMLRTCACLGVDAAIIEPAGFRINDSRFRRAAMDYVNTLTVESHNSWPTSRPGACRVSAASRC